MIEFSSALGLRRRKSHVTHFRLKSILLRAYGAYVSHWALETSLFGKRTRGPERGVHTIVPGACPGRLEVDFLQRVHYEGWIWYSFTRYKAVIDESF